MILYQRSARVIMFAIYAVVVAHCAGRSHSAGDIPKIPPAEEPPSTQESVVSRDAGSSSVSEDQAGTNDRGALEQ